MTTNSKMLNVFFAILGASLAIYGFNALLTAVGRDFEWENAKAIWPTVQIIAGLLIAILAPRIGGSLGISEEHLERESIEGGKDTESGYAESDGGDGGD